jgi:hypothetical protein
MMEQNLFQEVQEDLERQKLEALWKKYGLWVIVAALGLVISTASSTAYRSWKADRDQRLTSALISAAHVLPDTSKNIELLQNFAEGNAGERLASLSLLRAGAVALDREDKTKAIHFFDEVAGNAKADPAFRQLGELLSVQAQLDTGDPAALFARLQPLTAEGAAWRFSALENQAYLALRKGDAAKAMQIFTDISQDTRAPPSIAVRASDILRSLN